MSAPVIRVVGGGPAGAAASLLLASWGHRVTLHCRSGIDHRLPVSLPPSCGKLFDAIGVTEDIERADFIRSTGNTVWWGGQEPRVESFAPGQRGWQLDVHELAAVCRRRGVAAGVTIAADAAMDDGSALTLDCSGRAGVIAKARRLREYDDGPRTVALVGEWRRSDRWNVPDDTHTLVESYEAGWMWSVPTRHGTRHIAAMVDPRRSDLARTGSSQETYLGEIHKTRIFRRLTDGSSLVDGPWGWDVSPYRARRYAGDGWLLVGDAGSFIDPLSSAGVKKALASAWLAAIVANTCLTMPAMAEAAREFYARREHEIAEQLGRQGRRFLAAAAAGHHHPFWDERAEGAADEGGADEVRQAFERLKSADGLRAKTAAALRIESRPCVRGNQIVLEPHVVVAGGPDIRYVNGIDVVRLIELAPAETEVPGLFTTYVACVGPVSLPDFLHALATTFAKGWLVSE